MCKRKRFQIAIGFYPPRRTTMPRMKATDSLVLVVLVELAALPLTTMLSMVGEAEVVVDMEMVPQA